MKKTVLLLTLLLIGSYAYSATAPFGYSLQDDVYRSRNKAQQAQQGKAKTTPSKTNNQKNDEPKFYSDNIDAAWEKEGSYYSPANINSVIRKYKAGNYSGSLQEAISLSKRDPSNPIIYYYMAMAYTQVGNKDQALKAYEKVIKLNADKTLTQYATRGRDCLVGGPTCTTSQSEKTELDEFIEAPYGNGISKDLDKQIQEQKLRNLQNQINKKKDLNQQEIEDMHTLDHKSEIPSDNDIVNAIDTLKKAGITVSIMPQPNYQLDEMNMLLGNNNNDMMMNMLLMSNGKNLDPRIFQSMMMSSMIPDFNNDNK